MADQQPYSDTDLTATAAKTAGYADVPATWPARHPGWAEVLRGALKTLPVIGAIGGGLLGEGVLSVPGAALGAGVGKGAQDLLAQVTGLEQTTPAEKARGIMNDVNLAGAAGLVGAAAPALKPYARQIVGQPLRYAGKFIQSPTKTVGKMIETAGDKILEGPSPSALDAANIGDASRRVMQQGRAPMPYAAPAELPSAPGVTLSPQLIRNQLGLAARRAGVALTPEIESAAGALMQQGTPAAEALSHVVGAGKSALTAGEAKLVDALVRRGASDEEIRTAVEAARAFNARFGLSTPSRAETLFPKGMRGAPSGAGGLP